MDEHIFESYFQKWAPLVLEVNERISNSEVKQPEIDIFDPEWEAKVSAMLTPMQIDKDLGAKFNALSTEIGEIYLSGTPKQCEQIRQFLTKYSWALAYLGTSVPLDRIKSKEDTDLFRLRLAFESIHDQGYDTRDTIVGLGELYRVGKEAGIDVEACVREVQRISSSIDKYGWGSMQAVLGGQSGATPSKIKEDNKSE